MSLDVKRLAELKKYIDERMVNLQREVELLRMCSGLVDSVLAKGSFKTADEVSSAPVTITPRVDLGGKEYPLKTRSGEPLGMIVVGKDFVRIVPDPALHLSQHVPPFRAFFLERILRKMQDRDRELIDLGELSPEEAIGHKVELDGEVIREVVISNVMDESRIREIRNAITWTFEKMVEKSAGASA